jgi:hypothetical protein
VPVRVQLDADHAGDAAPALELVEADGGPGVEEDPAEEAIGVGAHDLGDAGVVGPRVDRVDLAAQSQVAPVGDGGLGDDPGEGMTRGAHQAPDHGEQAGRGLGQRVVHARDERHLADPAGVHLRQHGRHRQHPRLVVGVDVDDRHPRSMPGWHGERNTSDGAGAR